MSRVFCISFQRTGTTSVGKFFSEAGFRWSGWPDCRRNDWGGKWHDGDFEKIFDSHDFLEKDAFEDAPWWCPGFYKVLYHRFPDSKFVLFTRDTNSWVRSMIGHSNGKTFGVLERHCKIYRREKDFFSWRDGISDRSEQLDIRSNVERYVEAYETHNREVVEFFLRHSPESLHVGRLEDPDKWSRLASFLGVDLPSNFSAHENATGAPSLRNR